MVIEIKGITAWAIIGCYDYERDEAQAIEIDVTLEINHWVGKDDLAATLDYAQLCEFITLKASQTSFYLLESLVHLLAQELLANYPLLKKVQIAAGKPKVYGSKAQQIKVNYELARHYQVALALGSNLANPKQQLITASELLTEVVSEIKIAPIYQSKPAGYTQQEDFYNTCVSGYTQLQPQQLLVAIKKIEKLMGKVEQFDNGPRVIDIDIIFFDNWIWDKLFLTIPHPRMHERDFVLKPLMDIEPDWRHPSRNLSVSELYAQLVPNQQFILAVQ